jgi:hypothetical protein
VIRPEAGRDGMWAHVHAHERLYVSIDRARTPSEEDDGRARAVEVSHRPCVHGCAVARGHASPFASRFGLTMTTTKHVNFRSVVKKHAGIDTY